MKKSFLALAVCMIVAASVFVQCKGGSSTSDRDISDNTTSIHRDANDSTTSTPRSKQNIIFEEYNDKPLIIECASDVELPAGAFLGEVKACTAKNNMEKNMISQFTSYHSALFRGDIDNAIHYLYKDTGIYLRKFYPGKSDDAALREFFKSISAEAIKQVRKYREQGIEINFAVSRILRKVEVGDNVIYVFEIVSNLIGDKLQIHVEPDETVGVSFNKGKNWTFNAMNEDTPNILRIRFSDEVVDKVMGY